jgi:hypothetical protein
LIRRSGRLGAGFEKRRAKDARKVCMFRRTDVLLSDELSVTEDYPDGIPGVALVKRTIRVADVVAEQESK